MARCSGTPSRSCVAPAPRNRRSAGRGATSYAGRVRLRKRVAALERMIEELRREPLTHVHRETGSTIDWRATMRGGEGAEITLGRDVSIARFAEINGPVTIGDESRLSRGVVVQGGTNIGERVSIGPNAMVLTQTHRIGWMARRAAKADRLPVTIGHGCWIGAGAIILPGVTVNRGSVVAAGAVVTEDVPMNTLVAGVPARAVRTL